MHGATHFIPELQPECSRSLVEASLVVLKGKCAKAKNGLNCQFQVLQMSAQAHIAQQN